MAPAGPDIPGLRAGGAVPGVALAAHNRPRSGVAGVDILRDGRAIASDGLVMKRSAVLKRAGGAAGDSLHRSVANEFRTGQTR